MKEYWLDVRDLEPPEPLERVLEKMETLQDGECICMLHRREPYPLYPILEREQFSYEVSMTPESEFNIRIWRKP